MKKIKRLYSLSILLALQSSAPPIILPTSNDKSTKISIEGIQSTDMSQVQNAIFDQINTHRMQMLDMPNTQEQQLLNEFKEHIHHSTVSPETKRNMQLTAFGMPILAKKGESLNFRILKGVMRVGLHTADDENTSNRIAMIFSKTNMPNSVHLDNARNFNSRIHWQTIHGEMAHTMYNTNDAVIHHVRWIINGVNSNNPLQSIFSLNELIHQIAKTNSNSVSNEMLESLPYVNPDGANCLGEYDQAFNSLSKAATDTMNRFLFLKNHQNPEMQQAAVETAKIFFLINYILHTENMARKEITKNEFLFGMFILIPTLALLGVLAVILLTWPIAQTNTNNFYKTYKAFYDQRYIINRNTVGLYITRHGHILAALTCVLTYGFSQNSSLLCGLPGIFNGTIDANSSSNETTCTYPHSTQNYTYFKPCHDSCIASSFAQNYSASSPGAEDILCAAYCAFCIGLDCINGIAPESSPSYGINNECTGAFCTVTPNIIYTTAAQLDPNPGTNYDANGDGIFNSSDHPMYDAALIQSLCPICDPITQANCMPGPLPVPIPKDPIKKPEK